MIDTLPEGVDTGCMTERTKRTYNLSRTTVQRVRELAERYGPEDTQDGIVEVAIERLYNEMRANEESALWESARTDPDFTAEMRAIGRDFASVETVPE